MWGEERKDEHNYLKDECNHLKMSITTSIVTAIFSFFPPTLNSCDKHTFVLNKPEETALKLITHIVTTLDFIY